MATTAITSTPSSIAVSLVDAEHAATALVNVVSQPQEVNSSAATLAASEVKHDVDERYTIRWDHTAHDPFATIYVELMALHRAVDELLRAAVPVTAVNTQDQSTPYQTEQSTAVQARRPPAVSCIERCNGMKTNGDKARASTDGAARRIGGILSPSCMWLLGRRRRGGSSRDDSH